MSNCESDKEDSKSPEELVEQAIASMNIEGIRIPDDEKEILQKIATGELDADEVADAIAKKAIENSKENKPT